MSRASHFKLKGALGAGSRVSYVDETDTEILRSLVKRWGNQLQWVKVGNRFLEIGT